MAGWLRRARAAREVPADEITAELTASYWRAYDARMASVGFRDVARRFPGLVGHAVRLGWSASRLDTAATIALTRYSIAWPAPTQLAETEMKTLITVTNSAGAETFHKVRLSVK